MKNFDIIILGGGHAGLEAAWAASQFSEKVCIITIPGVSLASAPCNPAVGGVGKAQVVREIDALGGLMGKLADRCAIQYRILNESKGYAVQSTRVQIDKEVYSDLAELEISNSNIEVIREKVERVEKINDLFHLKTNESTYLAKKVVVTTGTFLNGRLHTGSDITSGGRVGREKSESLATLFDQVESLKTQFKTGTPPRLKRNSIDFSQMIEQSSDDRASNFHFAHGPFDRYLAQASCYLTKTNSKTLGTIRENKEKSPIFNGQINAIGPRYCPSIEDKAYRYEDKDIHHVFVEPEGLNLDTFYPNGISTSLPKDVQQAFIRSIKGLEQAEIAVYGYAVEYDVVNTLKLSQTMEYMDIPGLYFAGQVCGTSGYEEAAGQGLIAGLNSALSLLGKNPFILNRNDSYIGVMIEDLVTSDRDEPYRLFTARSENRLYLREDNSTLRMLPYRQQLGLKLNIDVYNSEFLNQFNILTIICDSTQYTNSSIEFFEEFGLGPIVNKVSISEILQRSQVNPVDTLELLLKMAGLKFDYSVIRTCAISIKYRGYIKRDQISFARFDKLGSKRLEISTLLNNSNISFECRQRIDKIRPESFGQLQRIEGIRPATLAYVATNLL